MVFVLIFLPLLIAFIWLYSIIAKEIWNRRRTVDAKTNMSTTTTNDDTSIEKPTLDTQTTPNLPRKPFIF